MSQSQASSENLAQWHGRAIDNRHMTIQIGPEM
jgi:hypothetical protein